MNLENILKAFDINLGYENVKIIRHKPMYDNSIELIRNGFFEEYQSIQQKPVFTECNAIISTCKTKTTKSLYRG